MSLRHLASPVLRRTAYDRTWACLYTLARRVRHAVAKTRVAIEERLQGDYPYGKWRHSCEIEPSSAQFAPICDRLLVIRGTCEHDFRHFSAGMEATGCMGWSRYRPCRAVALSHTDSDERVYRCGQKQIKWWGRERR